MYEFIDLNIGLRLDTLIAQKYGLRDRNHSTLTECV